MPLGYLVAVSCYALVRGWKPLHQEPWFAESEMADDVVGASVWGQALLPSEVFLISGAAALGGLVAGLAWRRFPVLASAFVALLLVLAFSAGSSGLREPMLPAGELGLLGAAMVVSAMLGGVLAGWYLKFASSAGDSGLLSAAEERSP